MSIIYTENLATLDIIIIIVRNIKGELVIANESKQVYILENQIIELSKQVNALVKEGL